MFVIPAMFRLCPAILLICLGELLAGGPALADAPVARLPSVFSKSVDPEKPLPEYPRPQMVRDQWLSLNGKWEYGVTEPGLTKPRSDGQIVVPFPIQSQLSGLMMPFDPSKRLWYHRVVHVPPEWSGKRVLLHFGAISWQAVIYINGQQAGTHRGDYDAFTLDVTDAARTPGGFDLAIEVTDPIDTGGQPRGKQVREFLRDLLYGEHGHLAHGLDGTCRRGVDRPSPDAAGYRSECPATHGCGRGYRPV